MEAEVVHVARIDATQLVRAVEGLYRDELARELAETGGGPRGRVDPIPLSRSILEAVSHFRGSEEHTSGLQSPSDIVFRLLLLKKKINRQQQSCDDERRL